MGKDKDHLKQAGEQDIPMSYILNMAEKAILLQAISEVNNAVRARNIAIQSMMAARGLALGDYYIDIEAGVIRRKENENVVAEKSS
jgi:hypothetical protein